MQVEKNSLSGEGAKKRLLGIVDYHIKNLAQQMDRDRRKVISFNESLLEEWTEILQKMLFLRDAKPPQARPINNGGKKQLPNIRSFPPPLSLPQHIKQHCLLTVDANSYQIFRVADNGSKITVTPSKFAFPKGYLRKYCSYNFIDTQNAVLIGGSRESNPNLKSKEVFTLNIVSQQISKLTQLPYGVSSHSAVRVKDIIYVIGGNKDMNTVTKSCLSFNFNTKEINRIASLNNPSASHTAISWRDEFIYKFGGVGSCFGQWDLSPYIERYSLAEDEWEVINPDLKIDEGLLDHYILLANSLAVASSDRIIIFGGFDFNFGGSNKLMQMTIQEDHHQITSIGAVEGMEIGGFFQQEPILVGNTLLAVQAVENPKEGLQSKIISLSTQARYY